MKNPPSSSMTALRGRLPAMGKIIGAFCIIVALLVVPAVSQDCPGDCSGDRTVTVDELVSCLEIGLQAAPREQCSACDANSDGHVTVEEIVQAVAAALQALVVEASGTCLVPGPSGLTPCAEGTMLQAGRCDDRAACLRDSDDVVSIAAEPVGANGAFSLTMNRCQVTGETLVFEAEVQQETGTKYRTIDFGSIASGFGLGLSGEGVGSISELLIGPPSEGAVRVLEENGLENFSDQGAAEIFAAAEDSNAETDFSGLEPDTAAGFAEQTAANSPAVQAAVNQSRTVCLQPEFTLRVDNGNTLRGIGVNNREDGGDEGSAFVWLNRHILGSADLPVTVTALSNIWPAEQSGLVGGEQVEMLVYLDADADGDPRNAALIASQTLLVPTPNSGVRSMHSFDPPVVIDAAGDLYVGFADLQSGIDRIVRFIALQDDSGGGMRSFIAFNVGSPTVDLRNLANNEILQPMSVVLPGAWLVRAEGSCSE